jgi:hypothetical protein
VKHKAEKRAKQVRTFLLHRHIFVTSLFSPEQSLIDLQIAVFEHIEDHPLNAGVFPQEFLYGPDGDLCREVRREAENTGGDTAESDGMQTMPFSQFQTGTIAGGQKLGFRFIRLAASNDDGAYGMKDASARRFISISSPHMGQCGTSSVGIFISCCSFIMRRTVSSLS